MSQNMQKKAKTVASLELESASDEGLEQQEVSQADTDAMYQMALRYLERGMNQRKIADQLVQQGISRPDATELARQVWKENLGTRNQNVTILVGVGAFFIVLGIAFLMPRILDNGGLPIFSPAYLMLLFGVYLAYRGYRERQEIQ
ncbi:MAG: hypothetical protein Q9P01_10770 [Anaerolineae bacterium]|nr:hypothetical protein [Anaerolineae bacterium]MDQ7035286.1 hypothetical protein [Anaerolineae bacterium]